MHLHLEEEHSCLESSFLCPRRQIILVHCIIYKEKPSSYSTCRGPTYPTHLPKSFTSLPRWQRKRRAAAFTFLKSFQQPQADVFPWGQIGKKMGTDALARSDESCSEPKWSHAAWCFRLTSCPWRGSPRTSQLSCMGCLGMGAQLHALALTFPRWV